MLDCFFHFLCDLQSCPVSSHDPLHLSMSSFASPFQPLLDFSRGTKTGPLVATFFTTNNCQISTPLTKCILENWPFNSFFRSKCFLSRQIRLQAFIFPLRGVVFLHPVLQSVGMSLYAVPFASTGCRDYSITTSTLHFWTAQGYVIYWVIPHIFLRN